MTVPEKRTPRGYGANANDIPDAESVPAARARCNNLADARAYSDWYRLGRGFAVRFELVDGWFRVSWDPHPPAEGDLLMMALAERRAAAFVVETLETLVPADHVGLLR